MHLGQLDRKAAHIDAVQPQQGALGRETPTRGMEPAKVAAEGLGEP